MKKGSLHLLPGVYVREHEVEQQRKKGSGAQGVGEGFESAQRGWERAGGQPEAQLFWVGDRTQGSQQKGNKRW